MKKTNCGRPFFREKEKEREREREREREKEKKKNQGKESTTIRERGELDELTRGSRVDPSVNAAFDTLARARCQVTQGSRSTDSQQADLPP